MHKKIAFSILLMLALTTMALAFAGDDEVVQVQPAVVVASAETGEATDETPSLWFVELSSAPTADGTSLATIRAEQRAFRANAGNAGLVYTERFAFSTLWNGLSIRIASSQLAKLSRIAGVKNIYPVDVIRVPETTLSDPELWTSLAMIGADIAQSELGYTGAGIKVAVMDTGIDYDHQALGGDGVARSDSTEFPTNRVIAGYDFVGDAFNADSTSSSYNPTPVPDLYPDDCYGHGTHVAGIIGANHPTNGLKGVAPDVKFGSYRVFGCAGSTTGDIMIAAMERALAEGMQVLNMSIGSAYQWPQYPTAMAANRLVNKGVVVVASIGNNGANGLYSAGAPGLGEKVIGVASYDNTSIAQTAFSITPDGKPIGYNPATGAPPAPFSGTLSISAPTPVVACPVLVNDHYVSPFEPGSLTGKAVLVNRGTCSFYWKARFAEEAGAAAVIIANNAAGQLNPSVDPSGGAAFTPIPCPSADFPSCPAVDVPTVAILQSDGNLIRDRLASGPVDMTWTDQIFSSLNPSGGLISSFSSYGLSPDLTLKPDIGAPGGNIYSTYPLEKGSYTSMGGTSMASPHVAGTAALYLQAHPRTPSQAMRGILQNSAEPKNWWGNPGLGFLDNVHRQGAGMVRIDDAILATTKITPAKISAGEGQAGPFTQTLTIENKAAAAVTYDLSFVNALSTGDVITPGFYTSDAAVTFNVPSVTVPAGGIASVTATITPATGPDKGQYGGYIVFTPQGDGPVYRVPFAGFVGDYQGIQVLTAGPIAASPMPWLSVLYSGSYYQVTDPIDWTYTMQGTDIPYFLVHFEHQSRLFRMEIFSQKGKAWQRSYNEEYMPRNSTTTSFFAFPFDGSTFAGNKINTVPDGTYYAVISVLKANGNAGNPADWETWTSPMFVIDRP
jgi:minor extracellular serine protease Vpr